MKPRRSRFRKLILRVVLPGPELLDCRKTQHFADVLLGEADELKLVGAEVQRRVEPPTGCCRGACGHKTPQKNRLENRINRLQRQLYPGSQMPEPPGLPESIGGPNSEGDYRVGRHVYDHKLLPLSRPLAGDAF